ncbi:lipid II flippase MurJ [Aeromonas dhakensis]|uniref:lipid II flippase MurJ n=1 Tax=Aeromonas dhakensis TaxID=196024 RepID=UPI003B9E3ADF
MNFIIFISLSILSKILASAREFGIAATWGTGTLVDSFIIAMLLPAFFLDFFSTWFNSTYVSSYIKAENNVKSTFFCKVALVVIMLCLCTSSVIYYFIDLYVVYGGVPASTIIVIKDIKWIVIIYYIMMVLCEFMKAHLIAIKKQKIMPVPMIISNVLFVFLLFHYSTSDLNKNNELAICFVLSSAVQLLLYYIISPKVFGTISYQEKTINIYSFVKTMPAMLLNTAINQSGRVVDKIIASGLVVGSLSSIYFSQQLYALYINMIVVSVLTFAYPKICEKSNCNDRDFSRFSFDVIVSVGALLIFPVILGVLYSDLLFRYLLSGDNNAAEQTRSVFIIMSSAIIFESISAVIKRSLWAKNLLNITIVIGAVGVISNIALSFCFSNKFGLYGISYAFTISSFVTAIIYMGVFFKRYPMLDDCKMQIKLLLTTVITALLYLLIASYYVLKAKTDVVLLSFLPSLIIFSVNYYVLFKFKVFDVVVKK